MSGIRLEDKSEKKFFKGFPLDDKGCVQGAYPSFSIYSECQKRMEKMIENENEHILKVFTSMNIDPDVLAKQKVEIERLNTDYKELEKEIGCLRTIKDDYKKLLKEIKEELTEKEIDLDYLKHYLIFETIADWGRITKEDWEDV